VYCTYLLKWVWWVLYLGIIRAGAVMVMPLLVGLVCRVNRRGVGGVEVMSGVLGVMHNVAEYCTCTCTFTWCLGA